MMVPVVWWSEVALILLLIHLVPASMMQQMPYIHQISAAARCHNKRQKSSRRRDTQLRREHLPANMMRRRYVMSCLVELVVRLE
jgi:hypothetical protein